MITGPKQVSANNQHFLSFIQQDSNELHLWDIRGKAKCLQRFKPSSAQGKESSSNKGSGVRFTTLAFSNVNENVLTAGLSNGAVQVIDCATAKVLNTISKGNMSAKSTRTPLGPNMDFVLKFQARDCIWYISKANSACITPATKSNGLDLQEPPYSIYCEDYQLIAKEGLCIKLRGSRLSISGIYVLVLLCFGQIGGGGSHGKILAISHYKKANQALIASEDQYVVYDFGTKSVVETIISKKKSGGQAIPSLLDISSEDTYSIESSSQSVLLRHLKTKQPLAKCEGHLHPVSHLSFVSNGTSLVFASSSESECLLWNPKEHLKGSDTLLEISQPDKILDMASSDSVTAVSVREISADTYMVAADTDSSVSVFYVKSTGVSSKQLAIKSKTVKRESIIRFIQLLDNKYLLSYK